MDWHRLADSIAEAWEPWLPQPLGVELARNAVHPLVMGGLHGEHALAESVTRAIRHRRDVLHEPEYASITDARATVMASAAGHLYGRAALDVALVSRSIHVLLGIECNRISGAVWCGRAGEILLYLVRRDGDWQVAICDATRDRAGLAYPSAIGTGATPAEAAFYAFSRVPRRKLPSEPIERETRRAYEYEEARALECERAREEAEGGEL